MKIPIMAGIYVDGSPAVRVAYPVNMVPVPGQDGIADGYLRPAEGIEAFTTGTGYDRGAIVWNGTHYRVSGTGLVTVSATGTVAVLGTIAGVDPARMDYSFDRLGIAANGLLYYWNGATLTQVTDPNIGTVNDMVWVDGYFMVTDGAYIAVTQLTDPATVNPLKYGSTDQPDTIQCLLKVQNQVNVVSRYEIDLFQNVGGAFFPFQIVLSALITKGAVGTRAACVFQDTVAFVGGGRNEAVSVYLGKNAQTVKISSREIDTLLLQYTTAQLSSVLMETIFDRGSQFLYIHLPDRTIVYDAAASAVAQQPVWFVLTSSIAGFSQYRAWNILRVNDAWIVGDPASTAIGTWSATDSKHWGSPVRWEFGTQMLRGEGVGVVIHQLELVALTGSAPVGAGTDPRVATSHSVDGIKWSQDKTVTSGKQGDTAKRLVWFQQGMWRNWRIQRFRGDSTSRLSAISVDAKVEALAY